MSFSASVIVAAMLIFPVNLRHGNTSVNKGHVLLNISVINVQGWLHVEL